MKAVILAGGLGTRISEESHARPKPMIEIGGRPILWHIMKIYSAHSISDFIICCGYKGYMIKEYFANYLLHSSDVTISVRDNSIQLHGNHVEPWTVTLVDTGEGTMTGGRLKRVASHVGDSDFCFTYGDGLADIDLSALIASHRASHKMATITAVLPPGRYGAIQMEDSEVVGFTEKPRGDGGLINGGFFVLKPGAIDFIDDDMTSWEEEPLKRLVSQRHLNAYEHRGFWHAMDTQRDKNYLEDLWKTGKAPWKVW